MISVGGYELTITDIGLCIIICFYLLKSICSGFDFIKARLDKYHNSQNSKEELHETVNDNKDKLVSNINTTYF